MMKADVPKAGVLFTPGKAVNAGMSYRNGKKRRDGLVESREDYAKESTMPG